MKEKLINFWYHYKWHTIFALFFVGVVVVCLVQTRDKRSFDYTVMYAGADVISGAESGSITDTLQGAAGEDKSVKLIHYFISLEAGSTQASGFSKQNLDAFDNEIKTGEAVILLLSTELYERVMEGSGGIISMTPYLPETLPEGIEFYDDTQSAIRLSSLPIGQEAGLCDLPEDTWLCLRSAVSLTNIFNQDKAEREHQEYQQYLKAIVSFKKED
ncbi:MAG: hypothetical protein J6V82_02185 [Clostridia bacterium]|nr:hypothetical protein [Clostridia bacterium]